MPDDWAPMSGIKPDLQNAAPAKTACRRAAAPQSELLGCTRPPRSFALGPYNPFKAMQETVTLECTEARKEGKPPSRYLTKRNKKTVTERIEKKKYNPFLKRHTLHKEIK
jgi:large subunit ribosomal protein L33